MYKKDFYCSTIEDLSKLRKYVRETFPDTLRRIGFVTENEMIWGFFGSMPDLYSTKKESSLGVLLNNLSLTINPKKKFKGQELLRDRICLENDEESLFLIQGQRFSFKRLTLSSIDNFYLRRSKIIFAYEIDPQLKKSQSQVDNAKLNRKKNNIVEIDEKVSGGGWDFIGKTLFSKKTGISKANVLGKNKNVETGEHSNQGIFLPMLEASLIPPRIGAQKPIERIRIENILTEEEKKQIEPMELVYLTSAFNPGNYGTIFINKGYIETH